jgi:hypothetical protein
VIADLLSLLRAGLVGCDIQSLIDLTRVSHDDLPTELARQVEREL